MVLSYWWELLLLVLCSYLLGNFCAAVFISKRIIRKDIRDLGSKNPGTTNMTRVFGLRFGVLTLIIDFFKGFLCVLVGKLLFTSLGGDDVGFFAGYLAGLAVILGHNYPIFLRFKGGKGFATGIGVYLVLQPVFTLIVISLGILLMFIVDRISVFALIFFVVQAIYHTIAYVQEQWLIATFACVFLALAIIAHRSNIVRLLHGEEKRLGLMNMVRRSAGQ